MPFRFTPTNDALTPEIRRLATERIDHALGALDGYPARPEALHDARKDIKKLRALLRLVRPTFAGYKAENAALRDAGRAVSALRDDTAMLECLSRLEKRYGGGLNPDGLALLHEGFEARRDAAATTDAGTQAVDTLRSALADLRARVKHWQVVGNGFDALALGFRRTLAEARDAGRSSAGKGDAAAFHDWRKHMKYHWYHAALLKRVKPMKMSARIALTGDLGELLGDHHDIAALRSRLVDNPPRPAPISAMLATIDAVAAAEMAAIETRALALAPRLFRTSPKAQTKTIRAWWTDAA